jgi:hypothetical protein
MERIIAKIVTFNSHITRVMVNEFAGDDDERQPRLYVVIGVVKRGWEESINTARVKFPCTTACRLASQVSAACYCLPSAKN